MARRFTVSKGLLSALGQAPAPASVTARDIEDALAARGYTMQAYEPGVPIPAVPEPVLHLPPLLMPELHVPYEPASPYARYIRFLPYLVMLFQDRSVLDFGKIV